VARQDNIPRGRTIPMGAVPAEARGLRHTAPTYLRRRPGSPSNGLLGSALCVGAYSVGCWPEGRGAHRNQRLNTVAAVEVVGISSMLLLLRKINLQKIESITIMGEMMNDLSHIGRSGASEERRVASVRPRICHCTSALLNGERSRIIFPGQGVRASP
jgi:hypothetical protein